MGKEVVGRIAECMAALKLQNKKALVPYFVAGDPALEYTLPLLHAMVEAGANIIELGVPFSDPMAEGPVIQVAHERALLHNTSLLEVLDCVRQFRQTNTTTPIVLMGYANPLEVMGYEAFASQAKACGVDAVLIVDMPPEEAGLLKQALAKQQMDMICLIAPTTTQARIQLIADNASGYLYYVSLKGVTGAANLEMASVLEKVGQIRASTELPVCVGFGIKDADSAQKIAQIADGAVVGSALVDRISSAANLQDAINITKTFLQSLRHAMDKNN